ncbi:hypothetical protein B0F90DRAFT_730675 [Multifurca ochricompacta]|uniref:Protein kinase domain-containing protein n=1 Tax=Multifurca ochricompacta TaxID=376703 RepID=A0AAD4QRG8_9AGAM|nr:hypothetical protein B0F90DRAFT_730675 [Multifurca ochricompacta]
MGMLNRNNVVLRSTLTIEFGLGRRCFLFSYLPKPIHIAVTLKHPLSGVCHSMKNFARPRRRIYSSSGTQRNVFAAELQVVGGGNEEGGTSTGASASASTEGALFPQQVCIKYASGVDEVSALRREDLLYRRELAPLAGIAVPQTYGFYTGGTMAAPTACLIMELCASTEILKSPDEFCRLAMLTLCKVHSAGIMHNTSLDLRHFVMKGKQVLLVDFARAMAHPCGNAHPILYKDSYSQIMDDEQDEPECEELVKAESNIFWQIAEKLR